MADHYTTATVFPDLPLSPLLLEVLGACDNDLEDALMADALGGSTLDALRQAVRDTHPNLSDEALGLLVNFLVEYATGSDDRLYFEPVHLSAVPLQDGSYYLFAEDGFGEADLNWLTWALGHLPESVREIEVEWASWCSKPRQGEFSGGCALITRDGCSTMTTSGMLRMLRNKAVTDCLRDEGQDVVSAAV